MGIAVVAQGFPAVEIEDAVAVVEGMPVVVVERLVVAFPEGLGLGKLLDTEGTLPGLARQSLATVGAGDDGPCVAPAPGVDPVQIDDDIEPAVVAAHAAKIAGLCEASAVHLGWQSDR